ncbi:BtrH N-terminal domain-containing protein [Paenibacillus sp. 481]|uniref:BtrH N-terminal domain-containing protein n=1 Tax=Paenibacillus sp. 481 TaxID=2835869 RepID=UPI001E5944ED|nr:BtrH N-terminal domain-containing protein [Paenibacillus sp. 481]UHA74012.1 BtrH N-terminal domain-containing protein [Paenibacillus sp. 481]
MTVKELELAIPPIIGYQYVAYPLCTVLTRQEGIPWFYSNFIHLYCHFDLDGSRAARSLPLTFYGEDFLRCPWLTTQKIERESILDSPRGVVNFLVDCIDSGYTVSLYVDEFYIPRRRVYQQTHYAHDILIYGYDQAKRTFFVLGYDEEMQFRKTSVPFHELEQGFRDLEWTDNYKEQVYLFRFNKKGSYDLDPAFIQHSLQDYVSARNVSLRDRATCNTVEAAFGIDVYPTLIHNLPVLAQRRDIRPIHILWEHKKVMGLRIAYLCEQGLLPDSLGNCFQPIEEQASDLRHQMMKYALTGDDFILGKGIKQINELMESEKRVLEAVIEALGTLPCSTISVI